MADIAYETVKPSPSNASFSVSPFNYNFLLTGPRLAQRAAYFAFSYVPEQFDLLLGKFRDPGSVIAESTSTTTMNPTITHAGGSFVRTLDPAKASDAAGFLP